ncbi:MAG: PEGA domain-containing protein [Candidatus Saccharimonadales bacterium]
MDYLDPRKQLEQNVILITGYILIAISITIATLVLVYQAYGFGLNQNGTIIQNGLVFFSSQPNPANIYINGKLNPSTTNTRLILLSGGYNVTIAKNGYRDWSRRIVFDAGAVEHFDYPFLFPKSLTTSQVKQYSSPPALSTQSPDRRWILVEQPGSITNYSLLDLKSPAKPVETTITIPSSILSKATSGESMQYDEWADDNQHVLLTHMFDGKTEYILVDRNNPSLSVNLNTVLGTNPSKLSLIDKKYDKYYVYNTTGGVIESGSLSGGNILTPYLQNVLAYESYGSNTMLYVTPTNAPTGKVLLNILEGTQTTTIRQLPVSSSYLVDLTQYSGTLYVVGGSSSDNRLYIYQDPASQYQNQDGIIVPSQVLQIDNPNYVSFSDNAQFIVAENGTSFAIYDIENSKYYSYTTSPALDLPQQHAVWMDGDRLTYIGTNKMIVFDYDGTNQQTLMSANGGYIPEFSSNYKYVYTFSPLKSENKIELDRTPLAIPSDL